MARVIYLIRHLNPAALQGARLAPEVVTVFSSPLLRARRTAEIFFPDREIEFLPELTEVSLGEWEGLAWQEIEARWPELAREKLRDWRGVNAPGAEAWVDFEARVATAWQQILAAPSPCAVVAHAGVNSVLSQLATGRDALQFSQQYGEVIPLEIV